MPWLLVLGVDRVAGSRALSLVQKNFFFFFFFFFFFLYKKKREAILTRLVTKNALTSGLTKWLKTYRAQ
jgi:hypothetical protein